MVLSCMERDGAPPLGRGGQVGNAGHVKRWLGGTVTWRNEDHSSVHGACFRVCSNADGRGPS
jgi:hypothetical protein